MSAGLPSTFFGRLKYCWLMSNQFKFETEELTDYLVHRRTAAVLVSIMGALDMPWLFTPNRVTFASCATGMLSAWCVLQSPRDHTFFLYAALLELLSVTLDCCDGQLARLYKSGSTFGRVLDGLSDMVVALSHGAAWTWVLVVEYKVWSLQLGLLALTVATISYQQQCMMFDRIKNMYVFKTSPLKDQKVSGMEEEAELDREIQAAEKAGSLVTLYVLLFYKRQYLALQNNVTHGKTVDDAIKEIKALSPEEYCERWRKTMRLTSWTGTGTHATLFYLTLFYAYLANDRIAGAQRLVAFFYVNNGLLNVIFAILFRRVREM